MGRRNTQAHGMFLNFKLWSGEMGILCLKGDTDFIVLCLCNIQKSIKQQSEQKAKDSLLHYTDLKEPKKLCCFISRYFKQLRNRLYVFYLLPQQLQTWIQSDRLETGGKCLGADSENAQL